MRYVIYGAGAVGGTIGARLFEAGFDVTLVCRGEHLETIRARGLRFLSPDGERTLAIPAVARPSEIAWQPDHAVILTMKTQDTEPALRALELAAGTNPPVFCAQNGVANEALAARRFVRVNAMLVALPATHLEPGSVMASAAPRSGVLHNGRWPSGSDAVNERVSGDLSRAGFAAEPDPSVMRLKYAKLLSNLGNAATAIAGSAARADEGTLRALLREARHEALACYEAAGIECASKGEYAERVARHFQAVRISGRERDGGSTWQSMVTGRPLEVDWLNGEIVLLGARHGVPTPCNALLRRLANAMSARGMKPGAEGLAELERALGEIKTPVAT